jgi:hypothetical protein
VIRDNVKGLSFADVGGLWNTTNERVTLAVQSGASRAAMIDLFPETSPWWEKLDARAAERGVVDYGCYPSANIDDPTLPECVGTYDFVHCTGVIYHVPNPLFTLQRLRDLTRRYLVVGSMVMPDQIETGGGFLDLSDGACLFVPALSGRKREIVAAHFRELGFPVMNINPEHPEPLPFSERGAITYGKPWWWLYTPATLVRMVETAGFKVIEWDWTWKRRAAAVFCEKE